MKNSAKKFSAMNLVAMENAGEKHFTKSEEGYIVLPQSTPYIVSKKKLEY